VRSDDAFSALASPVRRSLLEKLGERPQSVNELADQFDMRRPSVSEHLKVLKDAGLVSAEQIGRQRVYALNPAPLQDVAAWLHPFERFWREHLRALADVLDEKEPS
jgi:DNA-binding transcriptional ArsR family regulator